jgi:release factor glutamine methyltransferase
MAHLTSLLVARLRAAGCVFAEDEAHVLLAAASTPVELAAMVQQRCEGRPLEHVVGWAEFCGVRVVVGPGTFVPRPRTELLVREAIALAGDARVPIGNLVVLDLCCGSGAIGMALAAGLPGVELYAADVDPVEVRCARANLDQLGARVFQGDLFQPLPASLQGRINILTANVPYVPTAAIALLPGEARTYEPQVSLDGGTDGLDVLRRVAAGAPTWLAPGGHLLFEVSQQQAAPAMQILTADALVPRMVSDEHLGATVIIGTKHAD